jgi:hypothetical protein
MAFLRHQPAVFQKHVHNAFTDTGLDHWLRERDINQLIICGIRTEQCCETTARVASDLGYAVTFVSEATLTFPMTHKGITLSADELRHRTETVLPGDLPILKRSRRRWSHCNEHRRLVRDVAGVLSLVTGPAETFVLAGDAFRLHYIGPQPGVPTSIGLTMGHPALAG